MVSERQQITVAFSHVLRSTRKKANLTQRALADAGSFDESYINRMEKGQRLPSLQTLIALEQVMKLPAGTLTRLTTEEISAPTTSPLDAAKLPRTQIDSSVKPDDDEDEIEGETLPL